QSRIAHRAHWQWKATDRPRANALSPRPKLPIPTGRIAAAARSKPARARAQPKIGGHPRAHLVRPAGASQSCPWPPRRTWSRPSRAYAPSAATARTSHSTGRRCALDEVVAVLPGVLDRDISVRTLVGAVGIGPVRQDVVAHVLVELLAQLRQVDAVILHVLERVLDVSVLDLLLDRLLRGIRSAGQVQGLRDDGADRAGLVQALAHAEVDELEQRFHDLRRLFRVVLDAGEAGVERLEEHAGHLAVGRRHGPAVATVLVLERRIVHGPEVFTDGPEPVVDMTHQGLGAVGKRRREQRHLQNLRVLVTGRAAEVLAI